MISDSEAVYIPSLLRVRKDRILMIGAGKACAEKLHGLSQLGIQLTVIAPEIMPEVREVFLEKPWIQFQYRKYTPGDLKEFDVVYVGINDPVVSGQIRTEADSLKIHANFIDKPALSDFISPSLIQKENFALMVTTFGRGPGMSRKIRQQIESVMDLEKLDQEAGQYIADRDAKKRLL